MSNTAALASRLAVLVFTDIVGSTALKSRIGNAAYARMLGRHDELFKQLIAPVAAAQILNDTGDGYFAAFATVSDAVRFSLKFQQVMHDEKWEPQPMRTRVGIHVGEVAEIANHDGGRAKIVGVAADLAARITSLGRGGQILLTRIAFDDARQFIGAHSPDADGGKPLTWIAHGQYKFKGYDTPIEVFEVGTEGVAPLSPPLGNESVQRSVSAEEEEMLGWRPAMGLAVPQRVGWSLERKLGEGTFGEVWLAMHQTTKQHRVFKFCFDPERLRSFKRELTLFRLLRESLGDRPDIVRLYDVRLDNPPYFLEGEYAPHGNLADWASALGGLDRVPLAARLEIVAGVADPVAAAHSVGVLHKDIKPSNILIDIKPDGSIHPRLGDFGIGILIDRTQLAAHQITDAGFTLLEGNESSRTGTRMYAPPESLAGRPFTTQGDIYALGVLLYQMAIGDLNKPVALGWERDVPDELLREDIGACLEGDPQRRIQSAAEVSRRIRTLEQRREERRRDRELRESLQQRQRRMRVLLAAACISVLLGALGVLGYVVERGLRMRAEASERNAQLAYAAGALDQGTALHLAGRGYESRRAFERSRDQLRQLGESTLAPQVGLYRSFREFEAPLNTLPHADGVMAVAWLPDSTHAVSAGEEGIIRLWDVPTGRVIRSFTGHNANISALAVSADGHLLLSGGADQSVRLWDIDSGKEIRKLGEHLGEIRGVAFSPDGAQALAGSADLPGSLHFWDVQSGKVLAKVTPPTRSAFYGVAFAPDGRRALGTTYERQIWICDTQTFQLAPPITGHSGYVIQAVFSRDGRQILSGSFDHTVRLWDAQSGKELRVFEGHTAGVRGVAFIDDAHFLSGAMDGTLRLWQIDEPKPLRTLAGHAEGVRGIAVAPNGRVALSASIDHTVAVWNLSPNRETIDFDQGARVSSLSCSKDGNLLLSGDMRGNVQVRDVATLRPILKITAHQRAVDSAQLIGDGRRMFTSDCDRNCKLWDVATGRELRSFDGGPPSADQGYVRARGWRYTAVAPDGAVALSSRLDQAIDLWSVDTGAVIRTLPAGDAQVTCLAFAPDGKRALSGNVNGQISYWDLATGTALFSTPIPTKPGPVDCLAFSADGKTALAGGHQLIIRLWDLPGGKVIREYDGHTLIVRGVGFGRGEQSIFSAAGDQTLRLWDRARGVDLNLAAQLPNYIYAMTVVPPGDAAVVASDQLVSLWDVSRPAQYESFAPRLEAARAALAAKPNDGAALATLGEWYALRGMDEWAVQLLEQARAAGTTVSSLKLAREYWKLDDLTHAAREFRSALASGEAPADYLGLCLNAVTLARTTTAPATAPTGTK